MRSDTQVIQSLHKVAERNFVDVVGGTTDMQSWLSEVKWQHDSKKPQVCVLVVHQIDDGRYRGALYITNQDFTGDICN